MAKIFEMKFKVVIKAETVEEAQAKLINDWGKDEFNSHFIACEEVQDPNQEVDIDLTQKFKEDCHCGHTH